MKIEDLRIRVWDKELKRMFMITDWSWMVGSTEKLIDGYYLDGAERGHHHKWCLSERQDLEPMVYFGYKDKNGNLIFEDDIIIHGDPDIPLKVIFQNGIFQTDHEYQIEEGPEIIAFFNKECEVIGNIYQNPELLEG